MGRVRGLRGGAGAIVGRDRGPLGASGGQGTLNHAPAAHAYIHIYMCMYVCVCALAIDRHSAGNNGRGAHARARTPQCAPILNYTRQMRTLARERQRALCDVRTYA